VNIAIARTKPAWRDESPIEEIARLTEDLFLAARERIYIEAQYFCGRALRMVMKRLLAKPSGPEILVIAGRNEQGFVERWVMGQNRERLIRHLRRVDRHNRLQVYYPIVDGLEGPCDVLVHSKLMIIDDEYLRVGSANLNNRSMGADTECDVVVEARDDRSRNAIAKLRNRLLGEHLGVDPSEVASVVHEHDLLRGVGRLNSVSRRLRPFTEAENPGPERSVFGTAILDPRRPFRLPWGRRGQQSTLEMQHKFGRQKK
jgi:phosphatidylserine/phosphatidylglycerophosphate/cardiolipin synthase-like enzyme